MVSLIGAQKHFKKVNYQDFEYIRNRERLPQ